MEESKVKVEASNMTGTGKRERERERESKQMSQSCLKNVVRPLLIRIVSQKATDRERRVQTYLHFLILHRVLLLLLLFGGQILSGLLRLDLHHLFGTTEKQHTTTTKTKQKKKRNEMEWVLGFQENV